MTPKNWEKFQHYKNRSPPWIKLHRCLIDDLEFVRLPDASMALAPRLWLLAAEYPEGKITANLEKMAFRLHTSEEKLKDALIPLVKAGFFLDDSNMLAECYQLATPEERRKEERRGELENSSREFSNSPSLDRSSAPPPAPLANGSRASGAPSSANGRQGMSPDRGDDYRSPPRKTDDAPLTTDRPDIAAINEPVRPWLSADKRMKS